MKKNTHEKHLGESEWAHSVLRRDLLGRGGLTKDQQMPVSSFGLVFIWSSGCGCLIWKTGAQLALKLARDNKNNRKEFHIYVSNKQKYNKDTNLPMKVAGKLVTNDKGNIELPSLLQSSRINLDPKSLCH